ncbi:unnamed protein product (macronuclear) [Paramecium tetraurelia]|uniref:UBC core domain-containing protein n=1 Tax=Paramecium tetraurelia TaxID=5888 RepID=A0CHJ9_PARTE|nr:uncharacterized protein GSPATT00038368001 [Paramecium tetraurelia]CAK70266.1 unnamed protein product [Paramecium tetraurelia]|eukprot:XP_001437663.1 hypothetical protein (macronuclear) [Paramecium tetraurelia strain d4-2]
MDNLDSQIVNIFKNEIQIKRIRKELKQLEILDSKEFKITLKQLSNNLQIIVEMQPVVQLNQGKPIKFCLYLDNRFPFVFPKVHLTKPTLADGRDYIEDVLHQQWSPSILLNEIIQKFPKFLDQVRHHKDNRDQLLSLGKYNQDQEYEGQLGLEDVEFFQCKEIINGRSYQKIIQLSNSHILILESQNKVLNLQSFQLTKDLVKVEKVDNSALLTWKSDDNFRSQTLIPQNIDQFMDSILLYKTGSSGKKIQEEEVTLQKFENFEIQKLLDQVSYYENQLEQELTPQIVNSLMNSYQQAIEYFSAVSDEDFKEYVMRLQNLIGREDVQKILSNKL